MNRLAEVLDSRVQHHLDQPATLEIGLIQADGGLRPEGSEVVIPAGRYRLGRSVTPPPEAGDRVLIAWVGGRPFILDVVVNN